MSAQVIDIFTRSTVSADEVSARGMSQQRAAMLSASLRREERRIVGRACVHLPSGLYGWVKGIEPHMPPPHMAVFVTADGFHHLVACGDLAPSGNFRSVCVPGGARS